MYSIEEKEKIKREIREGLSVEEVKEKYNISKSTIYKWKKEIEIEKSIYDLIEKGQLEEAEIQVDKLTGQNNEKKRIIILSQIAKQKGDKEKEKELLQRELELEPDNVIVISSLIKIAKEEGDSEKRKSLLQRRLELEPDNVRTIIGLIKIAQKEGDRETEKKLFERQLEVEPNNLIAMSGLIKIARQEEDRKTEKELLQRQFELQPDNVIVISSLIKIARQEGDNEKEKSLLQRRLELEPDNPRTINSLIRIAREEGDRETEKNLLQKQLEIEPDNMTAIIGLKKIATDKNTFKTKMQDKPTVINKARNLIYEEEDIIEAAEQIKRLLEEENVTQVDKELVLAELYAKIGLIDRAQKSLKIYMKKSNDKSETKLITRALELVKSTKTKRFNWTKLWEQKAQNKITPTEATNPVAPTEPPAGDEIGLD